MVAAVQVTIPRRAGPVVLKGRKGGRHGSHSERTPEEKRAGAQANAQTGARGMRSINTYTYPARWRSGVSLSPFELTATLRTACTP